MGFGPRCRKKKFPVPFEGDRKLSATGKCVKRLELPAKKPSGAIPRRPETITGIGRGPLWHSVGVLPSGIQRSLSTCTCSSSVLPKHHLRSGGRTPEGTHSGRIMSVSFSTGCSAYLYCHSCRRSNSTPEYIFPSYCNILCRSQNDEHSESDWSKSILKVTGATSHFQDPRQRRETKPPHNETN